MGTRLLTVLAALAAPAAQAQTTAELVDRCGGTRAVIEPTEEIGAAALAAAAEVIHNRVASPFLPFLTFTRVEAGRIVLDFPEGTAPEGWESFATVRSEFGLHRVRQTVSGNDAAAPPGALLLSAADEPGLAYVVDATPILGSEDLSSVEAGIDQNGRPAITFAFTPEGARIFGAFTEANIGTALAVVINDQVISAPRIQSAIHGGRGLISGNFTREEVNMLAETLDAGRLAVDLALLSVEEVAPAPGADQTGCP